MFKYFQNTSINVCADIESSMVEAFVEHKPVVFHAGNQSMINNDPIEKISHHIWLSNHVDNGKSKEISDWHFKSLLKQYDKMAQDNPNFKHIFWINDIELIPLTVQKLEALGNIEIRNIDSLQSECQSISSIKDLLEEGMYGLAIDWTKYEVGRIFGGIVLDINYCISTSSNVSQVLDSYSFIAAGNMGYGRVNIENSMFAASKDHPVLIESCNKVNSKWSAMRPAAHDNTCLTDEFYPIFVRAVLNNLDPYQEGAPAEIANSEARVNSRAEELLGLDGHANSWIDNA